MNKFYDVFMSLRESLRGIDTEELLDAYVAIRYRIHGGAADSSDTSYPALMNLGGLIIQEAKQQAESEEFINGVKIGWGRTVFALIELAELEGLQSQFPDMPSPPVE